MFNTLGLSLYLSTFDIQRDMLERFSGSGYYVFTSFHIQEEFHSIPNYCKKAKEMCYWLRKAGFQIIGDVSPKTLEFFNYHSILDFAKDMGLDVLRLDYGFSKEEVIAIGKKYPLSFNASTKQEELAKEILEGGGEVFALHNFYPRPETGLDDAYFQETNEKLRKMGIKVLAFIPGDEVKRQPLYEGLPTLEKHRNLPPYVAFLDLKINYQIEGIFVGDVRISQEQSTWITRYLEEGIINLPVNLLREYEYLYNKVFTIRVDSPQSLMRLQESREYSCNGEKQQPFHCIQRRRGSITMDNIGYKRYSGEIQILRQDFPQDPRVNVIGNIKEDYHPIMECIENGHKIRFIKKKEI